MLGALHKVWIFQGKDMGNVSNFFLKLSTVVRIEIFFKCLYRYISTHKIFIFNFFCKTLFRDQTTNNAAALPNKFDMNSTSLSKSSTNPYLKKSLTAFGSKSSGPNHDPGVNSDDDDDEELGDLENTRMEEDDMFR